MMPSMFSFSMSPVTRSNSRPFLSFSRFDSRRSAYSGTMGWGKDNGGASGSAAKLSFKKRIARTAANIRMPLEYTRDFLFSPQRHQGTKEHKVFDIVLLCESSC